ncbi:DinB family protein [Rhizomonospora bruguierae]|uniref:DinB family protein n=1 Tax=Rhizomonospora bruguierae TaxID=1581705 RepID=UPI001BCE8278|nr:DinB family protein [Micromonospora sp. NBRC 107566]
MPNSGPAVQEPPRTLADPADLLAGYLDFYRAAVLRKLSGLTEQQARRSVVPSGWSPLELVVHLMWVERRWLCWGFLAEPTPEPWGDNGPGAGPHGRWQVPAEVTMAQALERFTEQCERSRQIVAGVPLARRAALGGRFPTPEKAPTLGWILFHVLQEYARHAGHLDVAREIMDGTTGE